MREKFLSSGLGYLLALTATGAAVAVRGALDPWLGDHLPLVTLFAAVAAAVWFGGWLPAIVAAVLGYLACDYLFIAPRDHLGFQQAINVIGFLAYLLTCSIVIGFGHIMRVARARVRQRGEQLRITLSSIGDAVVTTDADGRITSLNPVAEALTGWARAEAVGQSLDAVFRIVNEQTRQRVENPATRAMREGATVGLANHTLLIARDGKEYTIDDSAAPIRDELGNLVGCVLVFRDVTERRRTERASRENEARFTRFMEHLPGLAWIKDGQGRYVFANGEAERVFGVPRERLYGKTDDEVFSPEVAKQFRENDQQALRAGKNVQALEALQHDDGVVHHSIVNKFPIPGPDGASPLVGGIAIDITERKQAEEALHQSEERYSSLLKAITSIVWTTDAAGRFVAPQPSWNAYTGQTWEESRGFGWANALHTEDRERVVQLWKLACQSRSFYKSEGRLWHASSGRYHHFEARGVPILDADGSVREWVGKCLDVEERVQAQEALRASEERFRLLANTSPAVIWIADPKGAITFSSDRWYHYTGLTPEENASDWPRRVLHPDDYQRCVDQWTTALRTGTNYEVEVRNRRHDGVYRWWITRAVPIRDATGKVTAWFGSATDIHELKMAQESLQQADRRKDEFLATLAHELRNPLAPIRSGVQVLNRIGFPTPEAERVCSMIARQVDHLVRLVDDLLDVGRITRDRLKLHRQVVDLVPIVQNAVETSRPLLESAGHTLTIQVPPEPVWLYADATRLSQVLANLLNNAAKYTEPGGRISITAEVESGTPSTLQAECVPSVVVRVRDNGIGIDPELLPGVFEMFRQLGSSAARAQGGLGIGLTLAKRLVQLHGGQIEALSEGPGRGSEFVVRLPCRATNAQIDAPVPAPLDEASVGSAQPRRILLVDDNVDAARSLSQLLQLMGHQVEVVHDGPAALETARTESPDVMLLDIGLPGMDGYEVARRLRQDPQLSQVFLIALTGYGQEEDRKRSRAAGIDEHLVKPVDGALLQALLSRSPTPSRRT
jgi:PAS domain S-box-containing protein